MNAPFGRALLLAFALVVPALQAAADETVLPNIVRIGGTQIWDNEINRHGGDDLYLQYRDATTGLHPGGNTILNVNGGRVGVGTRLPSGVFEVSTFNFSYWRPDTHSWSGSLEPPQALIVTNRAPQGWDPVIIGRMTTATGVPRAAFALGAVGRGPWLDDDAATQLTDVYLIVRDNAGLLQERLRVTSQGSVGIGTSTPSARLHVAGNVRADGNIAARYQDVAEWVAPVEPISPASVVVIAPDRPDHVMLARDAYDRDARGGRDVAAGHEHRATVGRDG